MCMNELSDPAIELIRYVASQEKFSVGKRVKAIAKGQHKKYLRELEKNGLVERVGYGKFKVTDEGAKHEYRELACEDCGAKFYSRHHLENSSSMKCGHNNVTKSISGFQESMEEFK